MSDYTPTTAEVQDAASVDGGTGIEPEAFDRWLEGVRAEARAEGALWAMNNGYAGSRITDINHHQTNTGVGGA